VAGQSSSQDKTEQPTPKRLRDARREGQVPRSRELSTALVVAFAAATLMSRGDEISAQAMSWMRDCLTFDSGLFDDPGRAPSMLGERLLEAFRIVLLPILATLVGALAAPSLMGGWNFASKGFMPDFSKLNPLKGIARIFSINGLVELVKGIAKFGLIGAIAFIYLYVHREQLGQLSSQNIRVAIASSAQLAVGVLLWATGGLVIVALIDAPYQKWQYIRQLKMTKQEVRDEYKESEGRPEVKAKIRAMQRQMSQQRMMEKVPTADVIVTNPTHYAVALRYKPGVDAAPVVVAKGRDLIAQQIREVARQNGLPLLSAPPLARALYRQVPLDQSIPVELYAAVAQVLTWVFQLKAHDSGPRPPEPKIGDVPGGEPDPLPTAEQNIDAGREDEA